MITAQHACWRATIFRLGREAQRAYWLQYGGGSWSNRPAVPTPQWDAPPAVTAPAPQASATPRQPKPTTAHVPSSLGAGLRASSQPSGVVGGIPVSAAAKKREVKTGRIVHDYAAQHRTGTAQWQAPQSSQQLAFSQPAVTLPVMNNSQSVTGNFNPPPALVAATTPAIGHKRKSDGSQPVPAVEQSAAKEEETWEDKLIREFRENELYEGARHAFQKALLLEGDHQVHAMWEAARSQDICVAGILRVAKAAGEALAKSRVAHQNNHQQDVSMDCEEDARNYTAPRTPPRQTVKLTRGYLLTPPSTPPRRPKKVTGSPLRKPKDTPKKTLINKIEVQRRSNYAGRVTKLKQRQDGKKKFHVQLSNRMNELYEMDGDRGLMNCTIDCTGFGRLKYGWNLSIRKLEYLSCWSVSHLLTSDIPSRNERDL